MRFVFDAIVATLFWSFVTFSAVEVYDFFRSGAVKSVERGLSSTTHFTERLIF